MSDESDRKDETDRPERSAQPPAPEPAPRRRLTRSASDRLVAGVCGGLGQHLGVDPLLVRLTFILLTLAGGVGVVLYLALALLTPREDRVGQDARDTLKAGAAELGEQARAAAARVAEVFRKPEAPGAGGAAPPAPAAESPAGRPGAGRYLLGAALVLLGVWLLAENLGLHLPWWLGAEVLWPLALVALGLLLLARRARGGQR